MIVLEILSGFWNLLRMPEKHFRKGGILEMLKYTRPELVKLEMDAVEGMPDCSNGSSVTDTCGSGGGVTGGCNAGAVQYIVCSAGGSK